MARTNKVILIAGNRSTGKSDFVKHLIHTSTKNFPKSLVVDTFDSDIWRNLKTWDHPEWINFPVSNIPISKFKRWKSGVAKMYSSDTNKMMQLIQEHSKNSFIVFEDATKYIGSKLKDDTKKFVIDSKQKNLDLVFVFHNLAAIPPDLVRISDVLVLFKTGEGKPSTSKYPWPQIPEMMKSLREDKNQYAKRILQLN